MPTTPQTETERGILAGVFLVVTKEGRRGIMSPDMKVEVYRESFDKAWPEYLNKVQRLAKRNARKAKAKQDATASPQGG